MQRSEGCHQKLLLWPTDDVYLPSNDQPEYLCIHRGWCLCVDEKAGIPDFSGKVVIKIVNSVTLFKQLQEIITVGMR